MFIQVNNRATERDLVMYKFIEEATVIRGRKIANLRQAFLKITGPVNVGICLWPDNLAISWYWKGKRYNRTVARTMSPAGKRWMVCPKCQRWRYNIYIYPPDGLGCRECLGLTYKQWHARRREPKTGEAWERWLRKKAGKYGNKETDS